MDNNPTYPFASEGAETELALRNRIAQVFLTSPDEEMYGEVLDIVRQALESPHGIFGFISDNGDLVIPSMTREIWKECQVPDKSIVFPPHTWGNTLWGQAIRDRRPYYANQNFKVPEGHIPVKSFLTVPVVFQDRTNGLLSVGNRAGGYSDEHLRMLKNVADFISPILHARQQRDRHERERRKADEELKRAEQEKRTILDSLSELVIHTDSQMNILWANGAACNSVGMQRDELIGRPCYQFWGQRADPCPDCVVVQAMRNGRRTEVEKATPDGRIWSNRGYPVFDRKGSIVGGIEVCLEITEHKRAEEALRASEARLNEAERLAHLGSWEAELLFPEDFSRNPLSWSDEAFRIFGHEPGSVVVTHDLFSNGVHPEDQPKVWAEVQGALRERKPYSAEHRIVRPDGSERIVLEQAELVCDPATDRPLKFIGTVQDITERRRLQKQIEGISQMRESLLRSGDLQSKLRCITDTVVAVFNADFARIWITRPGDLCDSGCIHAQVEEGPHACRSRDRCLHLLSSSGRYTHADGERHRRVPLGAYLIGRVASGADPEFITNDVVQDPQIYNHAWAKELGLVAFAGYRLISGEGEPIGVMALFSKHSIPPGEDALLDEVAATASQVIQASRMEEAKALLEVQLRQAQKMESVGRLAGGVAHDFNNMLQAILGNAALALDGMPPDSSLRDNLEEIRRVALRSADLTRQLLAFARKQTISPMVLDLNDAVSGTLKMLQRLIGEDIQLIWAPGSSLWPVKMDPSQVDQVLANLTVNARDALEGGGNVTIETANVTLDNSYSYSHPECVPGNYVMLAVSDTGEGMDEETRAHLFEPFFTTKELGKGTGLGLATVFGIVKQNNGSIDVCSEPGQGTSFKLYFPRAAAEAGVVAKPVAQQSLRGTETVLLVEDEEQILNLSRRILDLHGYTVLASLTPEAAIALATQHHGVIHLLITDLVMPGMNGKELKQRLMASHPGLKCLFMSGYTADVIAHHGVLDEGVYFLQKPFTIRTLAERVREVLRTA